MDGLIKASEVKRQLASKNNYYASKSQVKFSGAPMGWIFGNLRGAPRLLFRESRDRATRIPWIDIIRNEDSDRLRAH